MGGKIDTSTIINILIFFGVTLNFPKVINSLNREALCLWFCIIIFLGFNLYNLDNRVRDIDNKILNIDSELKKIESHDADINELKVISRTIEIMLKLIISK